jgi:hypothetical protein
MLVDGLRRSLLSLNWLEYTISTIPGTMEDNTKIRYFIYKNVLVSLFKGFSPVHPIFFPLKVDEEICK